MRDPKVIEPAGFDPAAGWAECRAEVDKCGGIADADGNVNWRAAFSADPGCCSCPHCGEYYWSWGTLIECLDCGFQFPPDWWPMYSWGVQQANREKNPPPAFADSRMRAYIDAEHKKRISHPYYRYGYEHPVPDPWKEHDKIPWREVLQVKGNSDAV
jgi:hypothetical protein